MAANDKRPVNSKAGRRVQTERGEVEDFGTAPLNVEAPSPDVAEGDLEIEEDRVKKDRGKEDRGIYFDDPDEITIEDELEILPEVGLLGRTRPIRSLPVQRRPPQDLPAKELP